MIVKMSRVYIAVHQTDKDRFLDRLGQLKLLHFEPVEPKAAVADEETLQAMADINRALQILSSIRPSAKAPDLKPLEAAREAIRIQAAVNENRDRLIELHRMAEELSIWGDARVAQFRQLQEAGVEIRFFSVPQNHVDQIIAEYVEAVAALPGKRIMVAVVDRRGRFKPPDWASPIDLPHKDRPSILEDAARVDADLKQGVRRLSQLARLINAIRDEYARLVAEAGYDIVKRGGVSRSELFAVQGWMPAEEAGTLSSRLSKRGVHAAVRVRAAGKYDVPPTLIRYSRWVRPIKGLFDTLGTLPGYREMDLSPFFMVALPIFAAMLIGDAGYGFIIVLAGLIFFRRVVRVTGRPKAQLVIIFGLATLVWGMLTANFFGITPETLARSGGFVQSAKAGNGVDYDAMWSGNGFYSLTARLMRRTAPLWREDSEHTRSLIIKISMIIGCLHLVLAHIRKALELFPDQRTLSEVGWIVALADMLVLIWHLIFIGVERIPAAVWWVLLFALILTSWFGKPDRRVVKRLMVGFIASLLPLLSTFSDTMSYIRLFAVGLASYYIASAFNTLGAQVAETATWFASAPIVVFGHALNIGLATIAIFAHGVRLNMLEFSNNAGVQWAGYGYKPFVHGHTIIPGEKIL
jgi:V/A-type H+-transporting ATPase subunit I